jgi:hypothetical protein
MRFYDLCSSQHIKHYGDQIMGNQTHGKRSKQGESRTCVAQLQNFSRELQDNIEMDHAEVWCKTVEQNQEEKCLF